MSSFSHISEDFYESSGMHGGIVDIESWLRETAQDDERRYKFLSKLIENKSVLDFGCRNGRFLKRAKKVAKIVVGAEPDRNLSNHFLKEKLEVYTNLDEVPSSFDVITLFHVIERLPNPRNVLLDLTQKLNQDGQLIVEVPNAVLCQDLFKFLAL